jgi:hypothetical protein
MFYYTIWLLDGKLSGGGHGTLGKLNIALHDPTPGLCLRQEPARVLQPFKRESGWENLWGR